MSDTYLQNLLTQLEEVRAARSSILKQGQSYSIQGSHSTTSATLKELESEERRLLRLIVRRLRGGGRRHTYPEII